MSIKKLKLGCKDLEERTKIYKILAKIYNKKPTTQRGLLYIAEDVLGYTLYEDTLRKYIKKGVLK